MDEIDALGKAHTKAISPKKNIAAKPAPKAAASSGFNDGAIGKQLQYEKERRKKMSSGSSMMGAAYDSIFGK